MTEEIQVLIEAWGKLKIIFQKDRPDAAVVHVNMIDEYGADEQDWREVFPHHSSA